MKKLTQSVLGVSASAALLMTASSAIAYDSQVLRGDAIKEYHHILTQLPKVGEPGCPVGSECDTSGASETEIHTILRIDNNYHITGNTNFGVVAADTYSGTGGVAVAGSFEGTPTAGDGDVKVLERFTWLPFFFGTGFGFTAAVDDFPGEWVLTTNAEGKIVGGQFTIPGIASTPAGPTPNYGLTDFDNNTEIGVTGCTPTLDLPTYIAMRDAGTIFGAWTGPNANSCVGGVVNNFAYHTCDINTECGQFGKSVPVPAFAAAALGLGLAGITLMTRRRRTIK